MSFFKHLLIKKYITREEYYAIWNDDKYKYNPEFRGARVTELIIEHRDKPDVVDDLFCYIEASVIIIKEYIQKKYPEHYRLLYNSNPNDCDIPPIDLRKLRRFMNRHFNVGFDAEKNSS